MEIAAAGKFEAGANGSLQFLRGVAHSRKIKTVLAAAVWRGDNVRDSIGDSHLGHRQRVVKGSRAVVHAAQNVAMQVNHDFAVPSSAECAEHLPDSEHEYQSREDPPHPRCWNHFCQTATGDSSEEEPRNQQ